MKSSASEPGPKLRLQRWLAYAYAYAYVTDILTNA